MEKLIKQIIDDHMDIRAELSGYTETLNLLQTKICQFDGSEEQGERNSTHDALFSLWRSFDRFKDSWDEQVNGYHMTLAQYYINEEVSGVSCERAGLLRIFSELNVLDRAKVLVYAAELKD